MEDYKLTVVDNKVYFVGDIDLFSIDELAQELHKLETAKKNSTDKKVDLYVTSYGGSVEDSLKIYDVLQNINLELIIHITGFVGSGGTLFAFTKHKTLMHKYSTLAFHELSNSHTHKYSNAKACIEHADNLMKYLVEIYNTKTNTITKDWLVTDKYLSATEAKELKIVDEVI
jgi:ATP-dependent protease ClpP protease subunit